MSALKQRLASEIVRQHRRGTVVLVLNAAMIGALMIAGFASNSLGLLSEGGDFLADSLALALGLLAIYLRDHHRDEKGTAWAALVNGVWLLAPAVWVGIEAIRRLLAGTPAVHGPPVLVASAIAAAAMLAAGHSAPLPLCDPPARI